MSVLGIDVSSYQGVIDWDSVAAAGYDFAIIKATEDDGYENPYFLESWVNAKHVGLIRGAYHFARPSLLDAAAEANYFLAIVGELEQGDFLVLDIEAGDGDLGPWALEFLRHVESQVGFKPFVYSGAWFTGPHGFADDTALAEYGLWLASYTAAMPAAPAPWQFVAIWQYTDKGVVPGIKGDVDLNIFNGPKERLALYGKPAEVVVVPPPEPPQDNLAERVHALEHEIDTISEYIVRLRAALEVK